jgi:hypothetical protein
VGFVAAITAAALTRALLHPLWLVAVIGFVVVAVRPRTGWRAIAAAVAIPLVLIGGWIVKNQVLFDEPTMSSILGSNLARGVIAPMPRHAVDALIRDGSITPAARVRAIRALAAAVRAGHLDFAGDRAACRAALLALPGIGPWTADYLGMRVFADPDAFPAGDLGLRQALEDHVPRSPARAGARPLPSTALVEARAEPWRPYRAYAAMHLWAALASRRREGPARGPVPTAEAPRRRPPGRRASDPSRPDRRSPR